MKKFILIACLLLMTRMSYGIIFQNYFTTNADPTFGNTNFFQLITNADEILSTLTNLTEQVSNQMVTIQTLIGDTATIENGYTMTPSSQVTNYWLDCGQTNGLGQDIIYASLSANNDVNILGFTNQVLWDIISINIVANGGNRNIYVPGWWPHFTTNGTPGWVTANGKYSLVLTNNSELRLTVQTNRITVSTLWQTFGQ